MATFEGRTIDLRAGWAEASACTSDGTTTVCFRSERRMDTYLADNVPPVGVLACSSALRLYANTGFGGQALNLTGQGYWRNLSSYGFSNITSSYAVGACDTAMADGSNGSGAGYPGYTGAGASASSMASGWDNRVSSVYIY